MGPPMIMPFRAYGWPVPISPWIPYIGTDISLLIFGNLFVGSLFLWLLVLDLIFWGVISLVLLKLWRLITYRRK
jgi:hypothetical protein